MALRLPTFNLGCDIWRAANPTFNPPDVITTCQLRAGNHVYTGTDPDQINAPFWEILLPALTDIRDRISPGGADIAEVPAGSGRYYKVQHVDDVAKGFANEYRLAHVSKFGVWPSPIP